MIFQCNQCIKENPCVLIVDISSEQMAKRLTMCNFVDLVEGRPQKATWKEMKDEK